MEIDLLTNYPKTKRDTDEEIKKKLTRLEQLQESLIKFLMEIENMDMVDFNITKSIGQKLLLTLKNTTN